MDCPSRFRIKAGGRPGGEECFPGKFLGLHFDLKFK
jgi:hypothetical protein